MPTLYEYLNTGPDGNYNIGAAGWLSQTFTPAIGHSITSVKLLLYRLAGNPGIITVSIRATDVNAAPTGADLTSGTTDGDTLLTGAENAEWREITFSSGYVLTAGVKYAIVARAPSGGPVDKYAVWRCDQSPPVPPYTGGRGWGSADSGSTWTVDFDYWGLYVDFMFEDWGGALTLPTVTTQAVTAISGTTATGNGNITSLGNSAVTQHGHCWNTTGTPTTADSKTTNGAASATGAFTSAITGLTVGTKYYVRAYATNTAGTSYGAVVVFWADKGTVFPTEAITRVTSIIHRYDRFTGQYTMELGLGDVTSDFGFPVWSGTAQSLAQSTAPITEGEMDKSIESAKPTPVETALEEAIRRLFRIYPPEIKPDRPRVEMWSPEALAIRNRQIALLKELQGVMMEASRIGISSKARRDLIVKAIELKKRLPGGGG